MLLNTEYPRLKRLPPYVFNIVNDCKTEAIRDGKDIVDFGMGNPDQPTPQHIVDALLDACQQKNMHMYSMSRGIAPLRRAICHWYKRRYDVDLNAEKEAIVTMGSKEGLAHLALAMVDKGDATLVTNPAYPIHPYGFIIANASVINLPLATSSDEFIENTEKLLRDSVQKPKMLLINFPNNPTTHCVDLRFFERIIAIAKKYSIWVIQDLAYADIVFDGYQAPSILQVPRAKEVAVEFFSLSKSYNMPGWRVGFMVGNEILVNALTRIKSYLDYGQFNPIQIAAITALEGDQQCVKNICHLYQQRRDVLCDGLNAIGWEVEPPKATMFVWAAIPESFQNMGSLEFTKQLLNDAQVAVSPGIGFGEYGDKYVRFSLVESDTRIKQAIANMGKMLQLPPLNYLSPTNEDS
ncbi:Aspartate aminotransferase [uncultured Candidatus Thioglobus sp.]|nr:Aspartate aminotransferase [uncultured Candidatus Thioglobus sp.]